MPTATNIVVKDAALVDRTFELATPAAGDGAWALWVYKKGDFAVAFPKILARAYPNSGKTARKVEVRFKLPQSFVDSTSGLPTVTSVFDGVPNVTIPDMMSELNKPDAVAFLANAVSHALIKAMLSSGQPAT